MLVIFMIGSSIFWLLGLLFSGMVWWMIPPLRETFLWAVPIGVALQEASRYAFWRLLQRAGGPPLSPSLKILDSFHSSLAAGLGIATTQAFVVYTSLLWDALGPGTIMAHSCSSLTLFSYTALVALCFVLFHIAASVIAFDAYKTEDKLSLGVVVGGHLLLSASTVLNTTSVCGLGLTTSYCILLGVLFWAWRVGSQILSAYRNASNVNASVVVPHNSPPQPAKHVSVEGAGTSLLVADE